MFLKRFIFSVAAIFLGLISLFVISEIFFRIFRGAPQYAQSYLGRTTQGGYKYLFPPNSVDRGNTTPHHEFLHDTHFNRYGYRGQDFAMPKPPGVVRIFAVGDSFTHGVGAMDNETIPAMIERRLKTIYPQVEVINAGAGNTSPITNYVNIKKIHLKYDPDILILFYDLTDLWDDWSFERYAIHDANGEIMGFDHEFKFDHRDWWATLRNRSTFLGYVHQKLIRTIEKIRVLGLKNYIQCVMQGKRAKALIAKMSANSHLSEEELMDYDKMFFLRGREKKDLIDKYFPHSAGYVLKIRDLLAARGISMIMVTYPYGIFVDGNQWDKGREFWGFEQGRKYTDHYPEEMLTSFARSANIPLVSAWDDFQKAPPGNYFFEYDGHLTPAGNVIVAKAVADDPEFRQLVKQCLQAKSQIEKQNFSTK